MSDRLGNNFRRVQAPRLPSTRIVKYKFGDETKEIRLEWSSQPWVDKTKIPISEVSAERKRIENNTIDCLVQYLQTAHEKDPKFKSYAPDVCIIRSPMHFTTKSTFTKKMRPSEAYEHFDVDLHLTLRFCTNKNYGHKQGFPIHLYTNADGSYKAEKPPVWHEYSKFTSNEESVMVSPKPPVQYQNGFL
ncbi:hypothetical protein MCOR07_008933 [Pyricularia oryzae]|uniref:Uncharacterized protein n=1 Tax=Pyricularia oryzae TaxID=318829 RepID=A0A4P7NSU2_PYROR|nr:hypothetical protein MCOR19_005281 [Pyricularia oryzae]KAI6300361.1 hypothetical protein MCOR34_009077 [Pyricularia oryzae]KAI6316704.1 hypothetical protein MCOR29_006598 [Pyricularia oryzae]KAI6357162.1 hypothetical protein MCOR32_009825 [Pyricularia oryzae]KAI6427377.1 hypothetical protein MCOR21_006171 [Pyricularia oryzae]